MLEGFLLIVCCLIAAGLFTIISRYAWLWWTRVKPRKPNLEREWWSDCAEHGFAKVRENLVSIRNIRDFKWRTTKDHDISWIEKTFDINKIKDAWFIIDHFHRIKGLAHTMLSFEFEDEETVTFSFESRREKGAKYSPWLGMWRAFELYLLVATEEDALYLRTNVRKHKVHMFRVEADKEDNKALFLQLCKRLNQLGDRPEWYHTLSASCTTTIVSQVNAVSTNKIPFNWRAFLPGHAARAAFRYKLIQDWGGYSKTLEISEVAENARKWDGQTPFSQYIREHLPKSP